MAPECSGKAWRRHLRWQPFRCTHAAYGKTSGTSVPFPVPAAGAVDHGAGKCLLQPAVDGDIVGAVEETGPNVPSIAGSTAWFGARIALRCRRHRSGAADGRLLRQLFRQGPAVELARKHGSAADDQHR